MLLSGSVGPRRDVISQRIALDEGARPQIDQPRFEAVAAGLGDQCTEPGQRSDHLLHACLARRIQIGLLQRPQPDRRGRHQQRTADRNDHRHGERLARAGIGQVAQLAPPVHRVEVSHSVHSGARN